MSMLREFEQIVGQKKRAGEPTEGVAAKRSNFLRLYECADEKEYGRKRLARPADNSYLMLRDHNSEASKANQAIDDPATMGTLRVDEFKNIFTQYRQGQLKQADRDLHLACISNL